MGEIPGIRGTEWTIHHPLFFSFSGDDSSGIVADMRDRNGIHFRVFTPLPPIDLMTDEDNEFMLGQAWRNFRYYLDRRFDDPFAFWPRGIGRGRWKW